MILSALLSGLMAFGHEGGHVHGGADTGKLMADLTDGKGTAVGKASLQRDGSYVMVQLFDAKSEAMKLDGFDKTAKGTMKMGKKNPKTANFDLALEGNAFTGTAPTATKKPFDINVTLKEGERKLLVTFKNLD